MPKSGKDLGKLAAVYAMAPAYIQRAVFVVVLSFLFFLAMMVVYYIRQNIMYFLLATAFLIVYLVTLFSWFVQRRSVVQVYENGISFKKQTAVWDEIVDLDDKGVISLKDNHKITLPIVLNDFDGAISLIRSKSNIN